MGEQTPVQELLGLRRPPIAVAFLDVPPSGLQPWNKGEVPAGCTFWQQAMNGRSFYTVPGDHYNCAVGSYTHGFDLPPERANELQATLEFIDRSQYVALREVPSIPRLGRGPKYVAYGPAETVIFRPDAVIVAATPAQAMILYEAALKTNVGGGASQPAVVSESLSILGRPGCAVLPLTISTGEVALSFGCKGNRTFTGLPDNEVYVCVPGARWPSVVERLVETLEANATMGTYYTAQRARFELD